MHFLSKKADKTSCGRIVLRNTKFKAILLILLHVEEDVKTQNQTWIMIASIQGNPVLASLQASSSLSSSFQGIYKYFI